jgi:hypothetical protein
MIFPEHKASLHLTHNQHKAYYETLESYLESFGEDDHKHNWVSEEHKVKALDTQELWELQWYPDTPIGSYVLWAADLEIILKAALEVEKDYK